MSISTECLYACGQTRKKCGRCEPARLCISALRVRNSTPRRASNTAGGTLRSLPFEAALVRVQSLSLAWIIAAFAGTSAELRYRFSHIKPTLVIAESSCDGHPRA